MYTLRWGIPETALTPNKITDDQYFDMPLAHKLLYKKEVEYVNGSSFSESYSSYVMPDSDYSPPSYDHGSSSDSSSYDSGSSFDFGGGDGGGGGASGDW